MATPLDILLVEDSEDDAILLLDGLQTAGFEPKWRRVETETDYCASLDKHLDIILSDFNLPSFSVQRALELLQKRELAVPFVIVSGTIGEERAVECLKAGATDYVLKDRLHRLGPVVQRALREAKDHAEHKRAELELRWKTAFFEAQIDCAIDGILVVDSQGKKILQNRRLTELWQIPPHIAQDVDHSSQIRFIADRTKNPRQFSEKVARLYANPEEISRDEIELVDGTILDRYSAPVLGKDGKYYGRIWTYRDLTPQRRLEEQFRQAQKMESIGQLAGGVAHDFNNLLAIIRASTELVLMNDGRSENEARLTAENREYLNQTISASDRAANLIRQLLAFSRKQVMQVRNLDLNQVVGNLAKMLKRVLGEDVSLNAEFGSSISQVRADVGMMEQILMNLAVNARDAMPKGGKLIIETSDEIIGPEYAQLNSQAIAGDFVCLAVSDTGCGIPKENLQRIFEPFFTTKETGKGTGLGLATVYGIVQQHHGWINVYSEVNQGTTFRIYLPALREKNRQQVDALPDEKVRGGTETILLVEDETSVRKLTRNILERFGYTVVEADSGTAALAIWRERKDGIALVLTDMVMPGGLSGLELARVLTSDKPSLRVIYTSGYSADIMGKNFDLRDGINFLQKPYVIPKLAGSIRNALDQ